MPTNKEIYLRDSVIGLKKKFSIQRRLAVPVDDGIELLVNRDFSTTDNWIAQSGISILTSQNRAVWTSGNNNSLSQACNIIKSTWYRVEFDVLEYQQGDIDVFAGNEGRRVRAEAYQGHISLDLYSNGDSILYIYGRDNFRGSISNISLKKLVFYEENWLDVTKYTFKDSLSSVSDSIDTKSWEFGEVKQSNASLKFLNLHGEFSDEDNEESIFHGYQRHNSKVKIEVLFEGGSSDVLFNGLLDDRSAKTKVKGTQAIIENITAFSYSKTLSDITISELGTIGGATVNELVYNIMTRGFFTDLFTVDFANIKAGYNAEVDYTVYEQGAKVSEVLKDLAKGHSIFGVDTDNNFYFKPVEPTEEVMIELGNYPERKIQVTDYESGSNRVIENFYWEESTEKFELAVPKYKTNKQIKVSGITNSAYRQGLLNYLGVKFSKKLFAFSVDIPLCPFIKLLDRVKVQQIGAVNDNTFILNISKLDIGRLELPIGAIRASFDNDFVVYDFKHSGNKTSLIVIEYDPENYSRLLLNLVSVWEFQGNGDDRLRQNSGSPINMVYENMPSVFDLGSLCGVFDGTSSYINVPYSTSLSPAGKEISIEAWIYKSVAAPIAEKIASKTQNGGYGLFASTSGRVGAQVYTNGAYNTVYSHNNALTLNAWHQVVMVYNGFDITLYLDGVVVGSIYAAGKMTYSVENNLIIGAEASAADTPEATGFFNGKIASIKFWNRELSPREIRMLYNNGMGLSYRSILGV
ncbi:hypothetical protein Emin_0941 [Elusimicrobium minutum Pei191]|uniref:LamG-like jellyroll fold domain-containing protein n=1 Tax=Elusimicrobium minutum (strain Pei191) TaxID=445932 RepID=B2KD98_ELUMP|nr:LamG domain-containing protein [Elusimicrobium minutum]ACC98494.1 hypothetical protein Emin_0941 [Elusimicrobium minutum Pei191]